MIVQLALLMLLMIVSGLGPGMLVTKFMRLSPLERLCTAVGISWIIIYLAATAIYLGGLSWHWCYAISLLFLIAFVWTLPELRRMLANHALRRTVAGGAILTIWLLLLLMLVRNYSGGMWSGDWIEHYDRTEFFLHRYPHDHLFIGLYLLPARPPMMNLITAFFLAQVGRGFPAFELCFAILNLSVFFPAALLLNRLAPRGGRSLWILVAAFMSSPFFAENTTYAWTKLFCAFYVALAIALYLRKRNILAFIMLAAGCLVHYSAGIFTLFLAGHYLWNFFTSRPNWRQLSLIVILCGALLGSWFSWSIRRYGLHETMISNTAVSDAAKLKPIQNLAKIADNIKTCIVPVWLTHIDPRWANQSAIGWMRDQLFIWYQQNLWLMMGSMGWIILLWALGRIFIENRPAALRGGRRAFWLALLIFCIPAAIATHGAAEPYGCTHVVLQPLVLLGIVAVAAHARFLPRWASRLLVIGWAADFCLGIILQMYLENLPVTLLAAPDGRQYWAMPLKLVPIAMENFNAKEMFQLTFIGDYFAAYSMPILGLLLIGSVAWLWWMFRRKIAGR